MIGDQLEKFGVAIGQEEADGFFGLGTHEVVEDNLV